MKSIKLLWQAIYGLAFAMTIACAIVGGILGLVWLVTDKGNDETAARPIAAQAAAVQQAAPSPEHRIAPGKWLYCRTQPDYDRLVEIATSGDQEAATRLILSGRCGFLPEGARVYLEGVALFSDRVPVRIEGQIDPVWTTRRAIQ